jgi:prepilin-type N-terminal cleavage/methylation domain-containing protein/prepilin-type processing-associated H-X9-DG protein
MNGQRRAFTLIELLVVIAIIAILAAILFPVFAQAKEAAKKTQDLSNVKNITLAPIMYAGDQDDTLPWALWPEFYSNAVRFQPYVKNKDVFKSPKSPYKRGSYNTKQAGNPFGFYMTRPDSGCMGDLPPSTAGAANWYEDIYFPLDFQWNDSLNERASWESGVKCRSPWWGAEADVDTGLIMTSGKITSPAKVVMWSTFPSIGSQWPGGCVDGKCGNGVAPNSPLANFWGANFKGNFAQGSNVSYLDGHAKYEKFSKLHPCGEETCNDANGRRTDFKAWGFIWASESVH